ncbi:uncharacterized protein LOC130450223 [Diorhabda sublineata]|uniref:uncharacterized protein LOC130450223 n=1 Tax=Diorhabda sublineata TaxID=1163346 RepID=UPI0024E0DB48|nr:uncharacterized protein LOC130450223 [Diorhabda sublineata]
MIVEDDNFVISGPTPTVPIPEGLLGNFMYHSLLENDNKFDCMVNAFTGETRSCENILKDTCTLAQALHNFGVRPNTIVSISSENSLRFCDGLIASLYLGATVAPINHLYTENELTYILNLYQPKIIFCSRLTVGKYLDMKKKLKFIEKVLLIEDDESSGIESIGSFIQSNLGSVHIDPKNFRPFNEADPIDHVALVMSSSGTTGLAKGVMLTDRNILVRISQSREPLYTTGPTNGKYSLGLMPFFHGFGLNLLIAAILNKDTLVVFKQFDEDVFLKAIQDYKISSIAVAPPLAVFLAKSPKVDKYDLHCIEEVICGAAPLSKETENVLQKRLNLQMIRQGYGLTEANLAVILVGKNKNKPRKPGSSGTVITYMTVKVRDPETGRSLGPNKLGEICIKGPLIMKGYIRNPQATRDTFTSDGWLKTGDLGYYDNDKDFFIVDRLKELIKYKGFQVAPAELEAILLNHPKVLDVGVVGVPDELAGELPLAFVVKKPGVDVTEKELVEYVEGKVSPHKRLRGGVHFINAIPKNPSGKILRRTLRTLITTTNVKLGSKL